MQCDIECMSTRCLADRDRVETVPRERGCVWPAHRIEAEVAELGPCVEVDHDHAHVDAARGVLVAPSMHWRLISAYAPLPHRKLCGHFLDVIRLLDVDLRESEQNYPGERILVFTISSIN